MADRLAGRAVANNNLGIDKEDIIRAIPPKLRGQEDADFEGRTHHQRLLKRGVMKCSGRQLKLGGKDRAVHITSMLSALSANTH